MKTTICLTRTLLITACVASASAAHAYTLQPQQVGNVTYLSGGFGDEERDAMQTVKKDYNLSIVSAGQDGAYVGDTHVVISDREGNQVVDTDAGPLFYAELPAGRYTVQGSSEGQTKQQNITVSESKPAHIHFSWK